MKIQSLPRPFRCKREEEETRPGILDEFVVSIVSQQFVCVL